MAAQEDGGTGSKDRATVALVAERVDGLRLITEKGFADVQRQLDEVSGLPVAVAELRRDHESLVARVTNLEADDRRDGEWVRTHLPSILIAIAALLAAILVPIFVA